MPQNKCNDNVALSLVCLLNALSLWTWPSYLYNVVACCSRLACLHPDKWSCCLPPVGSHGNKRRPGSRQLEIWIPSSCWTQEHLDLHKAPSRILYIQKNVRVKHVSKMHKDFLNTVKWDKTKEEKHELIGLHSNISYHVSVICHASILVVNQSNMTCWYVD